MTSSCRRSASVTGVRALTGMTPASPRISSGNPTVLAYSQPAPSSVVKATAPASASVAWSSSTRQALVTSAGVFARDSADVRILEMGRVMEQPLGLGPGVPFGPRLPPQPPRRHADEDAGQPEEREGDEVRRLTDGERELGMKEEVIADEAGDEGGEQTRAGPS